MEQPNDPSNPTPPRIDPTLHATVGFKDIHRRFVWRDGNYMLIDRHVVDDPQVHPPFCVGTLALYQTRPEQVAREVYGLLTRLGWTAEQDRRFRVFWDLPHRVREYNLAREVIDFVLVVFRVNDVLLNGRGEIEWLMAQAEEELSRGNYGMVPAAETAIEELLTEVEVGEGEEICVVCLEDLPAAVPAAEMPCRHQFHEGCIVSWLKQSHYCPICRFEMPTEEKMETETADSWTYDDVEGREEREISPEC